MHGRGWAEARHDPGWAGNPRWAVSMSAAEGSVPHESHSGGKKPSFLAMSPPLAAGVAAVFLCGSLTIHAGVGSRRRRFVLLKPLTTLFILAVALLSLANPCGSKEYTASIAVALSFSLVGDALLLFHGRRWFALGLASFLGAHIAYAIVFARLGRVSGWDALAAGLLAAVGLAFYYTIRSALGVLRVPVVAYMAAISFMVSRAASTAGSPRSSATRAALIIAGASLLYFADMMVAVKRFRKPLPYPHLDLAPYYLGQLLLALSASFPAL
jgi:uncharacterized membrane protein YhhN